MKTGYEVYGTRAVAVYTTKEKAKGMVSRHPLLDLQVREIDITNVHWFFLKVVFY